MTSIYILITKMQNKTRKTKLNSKQKRKEKTRHSVPKWSDGEARKKKGGDVIFYGCLG